MQRDCSERFLDLPTKEFIIVFSEQLFQVVRMDAVEVRIVDLLRLAQHCGIDSPRTVRNLLSILGSSTQQFGEGSLASRRPKSSGLVPVVWLPT